VEKGSLSVALWMAIAPLKAKAQTNDPPPSGSCYVFSPSSSSVVEYSRRGMIVWEITPTSATDYDFTPWGLEENFVVIVGWTDFMEGEDRGEFGYSPDGYSFYPVNNPEWVNAYRPKPGFVGVLRIAPILDDIPIGIYSGMPTYDDDPVTGEPWKMTIWEFWITPCPYNWRPMLDEDLSFTAWIEPTTDHKGNPMVGTIIFLLDSSRQPGHCLNACRLGSEGEWAWDGTTGCHDDFQFLPEQLGFTVLPRNQTPEGIGYNYDTAMSSLVTNVATVTVRCLDYGGWTYLMGYVIGFFGEGAARRIDAPDLFVVDIPVDKNDNHIADHWEDLLDPPSRDPLSDDDIFNEGDGRTDGDGLSLYEEYRGLMVRGVWDDFHPWIKDMFVMNFGAGNENPYQPAVIPNDAITDAKGFPGAGMPLLWLLNANEGSGYPFRVVNFLWGYAHRRDVYAAIVVPGNVDDVYDKAYGVTYGPIWGNPTAPIIEIDLENIDEGLGSPCNDCNQPANRGTCWLCFGRQQPFQHCGHCQTFLYCCDCDNDHPNDEQQCGECGYNIHNLSQHQVLTWVVGHELGHTVLWHQPDRGHHSGATTYDCLIWEYGDWRVNPPTEFCVQNPGCQTRWKLNP